MSGWLLENAIFAGILAVVVFVGIRLTRPNPAVRHAFWLLVLLRLVLPPIPGLQINFSNWTSKPEIAQADPIPEPEPVIDPIPDGSILSEEIVVRSLNDLNFSPDANVSFALAELPTTEPIPEPEPEKSTFSWWDLLRLALVVWVLGAVIFAIRFVVGVRRFSNYLAKNRKVAPAWLVAEVRQVAEELGINPPRVEVVWGLSSPMVWCLTRPRLLWPSELTDLSPEARRAVLFHELAHVRRKDHWVRRLESLAGVFHWWNPVFWLTRRKLRTNAELACDAWATQKTNKCVFAQALLSVCAFNPQRRPAPAVAAVPESRRALEERLTMILKESPSYRLRFRTKVILALVACAAIPAWSLGDGIPFQIQLQGTPAQVQGQGQKDEKGNFLFIIDKNIVPPASSKEIEALEAKIKELNATLAKLKAEAAKKPVDVPPRIDFKIVDVVEKDVLYRKVEKKGPDGKVIVTYEAVQVPKTGETPLRFNLSNEDVKPKAPEGTFTIKADVVKAAPVDNTIILSRTTYKLPADKAQELAGILSKFKTSVLEVKVEKDSITVTTTPDIQNTVAGLVKLMVPVPTATMKTVDLKLTPDFVKPQPADPKPPVKPAPPVDPKAPVKPLPPKPTGGINLELDLDGILKMKLDEKAKAELMKQIQGLMEEKLKLSKEAEMKALEAEKKALESAEQLRYLERLKAAEAEFQKHLAEETKQQLELKIRLEQKRKADEEAAQKKQIEEKKKADEAAEIERKKKANTDVEKKLIEEKKKLIEEIERKIRENEKK